MSFPPIARIPEKVIFFLVVSLLSSFRLGFAADAPTNQTGSDTIVCLLQHGDSLFASTSAGLYQSSLNEKIWRKLAAPQSMEPGGTFIEQGPESRLLGYEHGSTLFISKDSGKTWEQAQLAPGHAFTRFFLHPNGSLFAFDEKHLTTDFFQSDRAFVSKDMGLTWKDITSNLPSNGEAFEEFLQDPNHPDLACINGCDMFSPTHQHLYEANDSSYHWTEVGWNRFDGILFNRDKNGRNLGGIMGIGECPYGFSIPSTISNFFTLPFEKCGNGLFVFSVQVEPEKSEYTFRVNEQKIISVKVVFLVEQHAPVKFLDNKDESVFWGMILLPEGKERAGLAAQVEKFNESKDFLGGNPAFNAYLNDPNLQTVQLDSKHPYERRIDLSKFYDFSKPGHYKFQLYHGDGTMVRWGSSFGTQVIDVTITP